MVHPKLNETKPVEELSTELLKAFESENYNSIISASRELYVETMVGLINNSGYRQSIMGCLDDPATTRVARRNLLKTLSIVNKEIEYQEEMLKSYEVIAEEALRNSCDQPKTLETSFLAPTIFS
jgi:hypothetical protein